MEFARRRLLHLAAGAAAAALPAMPRIARAQTYPARPIRIVVGFPAGLAPDTMARLVGQALSERLAQSVVIENRPGAGSNIGVEVVVKAPPDGYTLLLAVPTNTINQTLYPNLSFNFLRDIAPVAGFGRTVFALVVNPAVPAGTVAELIAYAKSNPGRINMASPGIGTLPHVFGEMFKMMADVNMQHVPYRGNLYPDLLGGQVQVSFLTIISSLAYIRDGKLRALGVTTATRAQALPDAPPIGESVPGFEASGWYGFGAPRSTPAAIVEKLKNEIEVVVSDEKMRARFIGMGIEPMFMPTDEFAKFLVDEAQKWEKIVKFAGMKPA
ncbi:MAG: tripartite tricarboxylate transporter substrate binding protein [Bradyrhizobiaceae bacterium]|nr:tripartite tricarboxylate transporter substrate binding protein [Bradyrhizobiaceae bacterium]